MSMFGDYKNYRALIPEYNNWKENRDKTEAKRIKYLKENPKAINSEDIQKSKTLLRAIDIMDEYSQKRAEDMEMATEVVTGEVLELALLGGAALGFGVSRIKAVNKFLTRIFKNNKNKEIMTAAIPSVIGGIIGTVAVFPLEAWAAKAQVSASKKGRYEAMRKDLKNPNGFAMLTPEQIQEAKRRAEKMALEEEKKPLMKNLKESFSTVKEMTIGSKEYQQQRKLFEYELEEHKQHLNEELSPKDIENAKKDQQLLTNLIEKIDIASQDYAENAELATQGVLIGATAFSGLFSMISAKISDKLKIKSGNAIANILGFIAIIGSSIFATQIQKEASRVGRFKVKQELMQNPEQLIYVDDKNIANIKDIQIEQKEKPGFFKFLQKLWKDNKEYQKYKKTSAKEEKRLYKAIETLNLSPEQLKDAKRLQRNTFMAFNEVDENSQKYSENIEALGQSLMYPLGLITGGIGVALGFKFLKRNAKSTLEQANNFIKYIMTVIGTSIVPSVLMNAYITKEQKKASRVADMMAINNLKDYRHFADYNK